jgi:uracil-DNA glycosylase
MMGEPPQITLDPQWHRQLSDELEKDYMRSLHEFLATRQQQGAIIYPPQSQWFAALNSTPFDKVKVVVLGQDPYHGPGQAHGLCFSVMPNIKVPPSLANIYKELKSDIGAELPNHGCLNSWAEQGVLLLNATLTVEQGLAGAHQGKGWETFTDNIIDKINDHRQGVVFMLWGSYAQKKASMIDAERHLVLQSVHPSPLSAYRGFFGCEHFSKANHYLESLGLDPVDWRLPRLKEIVQEELDF